MRFLILGVLLQGACNAALGRDLTLADAFRFGAVAFAMAAAGAAVAARVVPDSGERVTIPARGAIALNVTTAVTFLSFYACLVWIPASVAAGIEAGVAAAVALLAWGRRARAGQWLVVVLLLLATTTFGVLQADLDRVGSGTALGMLLAAVAGAGMASVSILSHDLGGRGVRARDVLRTRYHLTYVVAGVVAVALTVGDPTQAELSWASLVGLALLAVVVPLAAYQVGLGRTPPVRAMGVLALVPIVSFVVETALGRDIDPASNAAVVVVVTLAVAVGRFRPLQPVGDPDPVARGHARP